MLFKTLIFFCFAGASLAYRSYENYKVYNVVPTSEIHIQMLGDLKKAGYDFWTDILTIGGNARVMVAPEQEQEFVNYAHSVGLKPNVTISNVQALINSQLQPATNARSSTLGSFSWDRYYSLAQIHAWLDELVTLYPGVVTTMVIGTSFEGRELKGIVIDFKKGERGNNPLIGMIEGGIHSREWISPATVTWIIKEFLTSDDPDVRFLAETFIWHIVPVTNPDGYTYTFSEDRMWRKNRNPVNYVPCSTGNLDLGNGIDLNRNFNFLWMTTGASSNPCTQTYAGPSPSSELEAQAISNYVLRLKETGNFLYYFAFHSYSQMILVPYSHVSGQNVLEASNYADMYEIAIRGAEKLTARHGTQYQVGTSADILYEVSGSSFDWVKGVADIPIVYLFELRDVGEFGFLLSSEQIIPNNEEILDCLVEMDKTTRQLSYYSGTVPMYASFICLATSILFLILMK
ncbi:zinc carboxypeptidase-like [Bombyx mandarina]|uniref:Zinc carboxypeptidase A 1 n=1 Tax=Bombyx mandarina TaxID=7092 RepID=A0A6J2JR01_BOMMA|nr:zinc carboxypeptidase-like [Bombyx mandarina]